jgi:PAS domain S-box-containing protein
VAIFEQFTNPAYRNAWPMRAVLAAAGATIAIAGLVHQQGLVGGAGLTPVPAVLMATVVLSGWRWAAVSAIAIAVAAVLVPGLTAGWIMLLAGVSLLCGEALRRGMGPLGAWVLQMLPVAGATLPSLIIDPEWSRVELLAGSSAFAGVNVALAAGVLLLVPRRSQTFPPHRRVRWDHYTFVVLVGGVSAIAIVMLAGTGPGSIRVRALQLLVLVAATLLASYFTAWWCRVATRRLERDFLRKSRVRHGQGRHLRHTTPLPMELLVSRASIRRYIGELMHTAGRNKRQLLELRRVAVHLQDELKRAAAAVPGGSGAVSDTAPGRDEVQDRYRVLMEGAGEAAIFVDSSGIIAALSRSAASLLGQEESALLGKPVASLIPHDHVTPHPLDGSEAAQREEGGEYAEGPVRTAAGKILHVDIQTQRFHSRGGAHRLIRLRESRPMQEALATLEEAKQMNRSADQARDVFVATMSHELRTPLHGLIATLDMLRAGGASTEDFQHQLSIARSSARALLKIANDVLDVTRIKSNLFTLEKKRFSMNTILREVVEEASARAASLGLSMSSQVVDTLPPSFVGDPGRLKQILGNLVSNALKFTASGGVTLRVQYDGQLCIVDVQDTGEGIPASKRSCIFDPFVQLDTKAGRQAGGTGLGLPISRRLAEAMKGQLTLHQSGPQGSTFRLVLPLEASSESPPEDDSQRIFTNPRGRILVVEDNSANRYVAEALLAGMDCPATIVEGGQEALNVLREREFDLILMDCQMPGMDGYETTRRVRQLLDRRVPIIAMTASAMADDRNHCLEAGMDDFLPKPFNRAALNAVLRKWLAAGSGADADAAVGLDARAGMHPDLDVGVFDELRESLQWKSAPLERIRTSFVATVERTLPLLENPDADRNALLRHLHTVMGSSGMVGARQVEFLAGQMQRALNDHGAGALDGAAGMLRRAMQRYQRAVDRRLNMGADYPRQSRPMS